jgi:hypothetical protein
MGHSILVSCPRKMDMVVAAVVEVEAQRLVMVAAEEEVVDSVSSRSQHW